MFYFKSLKIESPNILSLTSKEINFEFFLPKISLIISIENFPKDIPERFNDKIFGEKQFIK